MACSFLLSAQAPPAFSSGEIYQKLLKLRVLGSVLYIAAHPDDENTRLLAWLSKERLYRTAYLSITRGDGGQNLIGDEQGVDLGLIRTQELLAARRVDGAEQYFTRAFDFGFTKTTTEALQTWDKEKILSDVVWVIRKFQPDIIIARFPEDSRAGHGHHSGSAVLAHEAFTAAADPLRFPDQLSRGVTAWQARRIMWNTFNFGTTNTTSEDQLKIDVGAYNPFLGKSYGELAAESRSQHKSQGFGVPASRGVQWEYFNPVAGEIARNDIMDGVSTGWSRLPGGEAIQQRIDSAIRNFNLSQPQTSLPVLTRIYKALTELNEGNWKRQKLEEVGQLIEACSGMWLEAFTNKEYAVQGDSVFISCVVNNRLGAPARLRGIRLPGKDSVWNQQLDINKNISWNAMLPVRRDQPLSQPYWMIEKMSAGSFQVADPLLIGNPENDPAYTVQFDVEVHGQPLSFFKPVRYKYTDPVKGERYQPLVIVPPAVVSTDPGIVIFRKNESREAEVSVRLTAYRNVKGTNARITGRLSSTQKKVTDSSLSLARGMSRDFTLKIPGTSLKGLSQDNLQGFAEWNNEAGEQSAYLNLTSIQYDHIPNIHYFYTDAVRLLQLDLKTEGKKVGYIDGAGDKVSLALQQMGYEVTPLKEKDLTSAYLRQFDAIITGVRAYNIHAFLEEKYEVLMNYVQEGGNLIVQYNTNNFISNVKSRIGPYPFSITRNRVTDETAKVRILLPDHPVLNYPNKITDADFDGWVQERGIYYAESSDPHYEMPLAMNDRDEPEQKGSLIIAGYGKGKFVYTGLVFFRQLPAGVPGAYRLLANLIALNQKKSF